TLCKNILQFYAKRACKKHNWAEKQKKELPKNIWKHINTVCAAYDEITNKYYYGRNKGYLEEGYIKNPAIFGDKNTSGVLPPKSLNRFPVGNCAEVDAVNRALNDGAKMSDLHLTTIHTTKKLFGVYKPSCENCEYAFKGKIKENYSGWKGDII
ncbi:MAG: hypothetical protein Q4F00_02725, partial [bacterium]|nr:hypothetical protein [bacterium]